MGLKPIAYHRIYDDGSGQSSRINYGFGAQDVSKLAQELGIGDLDMYKAWIVGTDDNGDVADIAYHGEEIDDQYLSWSLAYHDFVAPIVLELQRLMLRVSELEGRLANVSGN